MPSIQVTGVLEDPIEGVGANAEIRIISKIPYGNTTKGYNRSTVTDSSGNYDFNLVYGQHLIAVKYEGTSTYVTQGTVYVSGELQGPLSLIELIQSSATPPDPEIVSLLQQIAAEANASAESSALSAQESATARNESESFRDQTQALRDNTAEISGLDTVTDAIALSNPGHPDFYASFNDSVSIESGHGTRDQIDVSAAQDGSVLVDLPTKSVDFSRASVKYIPNKSGVIEKFGVDIPAIGPDGLDVSGNTTNVALYNTDFTNAFWSKENLTVGLAGDNYTIVNGETVSVQRLTSAATSFNSLRIPASSKLTGDRRLYWVIARAGSLDSFYISVTNSDGVINTSAVEFDLSSVTSTPNGNTGVISHKIKELSGGFYFCSMYMEALTDGGQEKLVDITVSAGATAGKTIDVLAVGVNTGNSAAISISEASQAITSRDIPTTQSMSNLPAAGMPFSIATDYEMTAVPDVLSAVFWINGQGSFQTATLQWVNGTLRFYANSTQWIVLGSSSLLGKHKIAVTYDGASVYIDLDGVQIGTFTPSLGLIYDVNSLIGIGCSSNNFTRQINGTIKRFTIYNRALSADERESLGAAK